MARCQRPQLEWGKLELGWYQSTNLPWWFAQIDLELGHWRWFEEFHSKCFGCKFVNCRIVKILKFFQTAILQIDQVELGLPRELLINANGNRILTDYYSFIVDSANLFGANVTKATPEMLDLLRFEIKLAKVWSKFNHFWDKWLIFHFPLLDFDE